MENPGPQKMKILKEILTHPDFSRMNVEQQKQFIEDLFKKGVTKSQLRTVLSEIQKERREGSSLSKLKKDEMILITDNMTPDEIVILCKHEKKYLPVCNNPRFWYERLIRDYPRLARNPEAKINPKNLYLENTKLTYIVSYDPNAKIYVRDHYGAKLYMYEIFEKDGYLVESGNWDDELLTSVEVSGNLIESSKVWVTAYTGLEGPLLTSFATREKAIRYSIKTVIIENFRYLFSLAAKKLDESEAYEEIPVNSFSTIAEYPAALDIKKKGDTYFLKRYTQKTLNVLHSMGYPQFRVGDTLQETQQVLYDYIDINGFFLWGIDFSLEEEDVNAADFNSLEVFELALHDYPPEWFKDYE